MCLVVLSFGASRHVPLVLAANRDELHARPAVALAWWREPRLAAGRDLEAGGTWLGVGADGRFAALTNVRGGGRRPTGLRSRGELVPEFLAGKASPHEYLARLAGHAARYPPFHLLVASESELAYLSSAEREPRALGAGLHALGNGGLADSEEKVARSRRGLAQLLAADAVPDAESLIALLRDPRPAPDLSPDATPEQRIASAPFVLHPQFGTRCTTALVRVGDEITLVERSYEPSGKAAGTVALSFIALK
jgi:uncharacterized protein with NRDE domain